ncbi:hypothetical protein E2P81_ATG03327 [Venturia nashicola]|uniref:Extracellular mutant protein 11 C-terminal domain-containing protein n=1 Tax=Venturia nashicola TaxID=86259 RepID=A0A4Z1PK59_9PEZI|nr:hypothetical protein E6O75_ATG03396 [Venturia nashicola]TLD36438.1 hypothetical protein E2P81_ATG03327 [Venturia nashicola]
MSGRISNFVNNHRGGQVPQPSQAGNQGHLRNLNQQNASVPRVAVPPTTKSNIAQARNVTSMQPPARGKAPLDSFAPTEYSGSTTSTFSKIQVRDSQVPVDRSGWDHHPNGAPDIGHHVEDDGEDSGSGGEEGDDDEGSEDGAEEQLILTHQQQPQFQYGQPVIRQQAQQANVDQQQFKHSPFDGGDSYPPTTSGGADDEDDKSSQIEQLQQAAPAQRGAPLNHQQLAPTQQELPFTQQKPASSRLFPKGSQRQSQGQANVSSRPSPPAPKPFTQPNTHLNSAAVFEKARPSSAPQPPQYQPGSRSNPKSRPISTGSAKDSAAPILVSMPQNIQEPQVIEEPEASVGEEPQLDYGEDVLKTMEYEQLRDEDYDMNPSKPSSVLPAHEDSKPLPQRLEFAQKLEPDHQRTFFASLPLAEWEEAGDWFLKKFSDAVKKMTESRTEKRRLAIRFEGEVAKRHEHVASRKRGIDDALVEMSNNGRGMLRASTPKRQRGPGEGN